MKKTLKVIVKNPLTKEEKKKLLKEISEKLSFIYSS